MPTVLDGAAYAVEVFEPARGADTTGHSERQPSFDIRDGGIRIENSMATSTALRRTECRRRHRFARATSKPYSGASCSIEPAHLAVADDGELRHALPRSVRTPSGSSSAKNSSCRRFHGASPGPPAATTKLMFSSDAPCEIMRMLIAVRAH